MAVAIGFVYGRVFSSTVVATVVATAVSWGSVSLGCVVAYALGATVLTDWANELARRNPLFDAIGTVVERQGIKVTRGACCVELKHVTNCFVWVVHGAAWSMRRQ